MNSGICANSTISSYFATISRARHPEDRAVEEDVLASGQLRVEAGADLEQRADASVDLRAALRRERDLREDAQQRALARAVGSDHADDLAFVRP